MSLSTSHSTRRRMAAGLGAVAVVAATLSGCSSASNQAGDKVTITLAGPNQFTSDTSTFGAPWDALVKQFEKDNPDITLKTNVLPISSFAGTLAAQLTAGTAPELVFNQVAHKPEQVVNLDPYLDKPNPFDTASGKWIDDFDSKFFGPGQKNGQGHYEWIPFNLVSVGIYYNQSVLKEAGVDVSELKTFDGFTKACKVMKDKGINPLATDNGTLSYGWANTAIGSTLLSDEAAKMNVFGTDGKAGTATPLTSKSLAKAVLDGSFDVSKDPAAISSVKILKKWYDACATPNWSGVTSSGSFTGGTVFPGGKAATAWGTVFSASGLSDAGFKWGTVPFPTISTSDSKYATGEPAQFGTVAGGTSYMIPAYIKGKQRDAAIKFLQYVSSPKVESWLKATGSIPAIKGAAAPTTMKALTSSSWAAMPLTGSGVFNAPQAAAGQNGVEGYLIGSKSLDQYLKIAQQNNVAWAKEQVTINKWTDVG